MAGLGLLFGVGKTEIRKFERRAEADILSKLSGYARQVRVSTELNGFGAAFGDVRRATIRASDFSTEQLPLFTEPWRSQYGKIRELRLELSDFVLAGLRVSKLEAVIPDCRFDLALALSKGHVRLSRSGVGTGRVEVLERDLADFIVKSVREVKSCTVRVLQDKVWVEGFGEFVIAKTNFQVIASLGIESGTKLILTDAKIYFDWRRVDEMSRKVLLDALNPVVDLAKDLHLYDAVQVESVRLRNGVLVATGRTKIPISPESAILNLR